MKKFFLVVFLIIKVQHLWSWSVKDNYYYFALKDSILEILTEHQSLINQNKNNLLLPNTIYEEIYSTYLKMIRKSIIDYKDKDPRKVARMLVSLLQAGEIIIAQKQTLINQNKKGVVKYKKFVPAIFSRLVAKRLHEKTGVLIKLTSLSKSNYKTRNPQNAPDEWEIHMLNRFTKKKWMEDHGIGERILRDKFRYIKPIVVRRACLSCHGKPAGEKDIYGHVKEGYVLNEIRGGISIIIPFPIESSKSNKKKEAILDKGGPQ